MKPFISLKLIIFPPYAILQLARFTFRSAYFIQNSLRSVLQTAFAPRFARSSCVKQVDGRFASSCKHIQNSLRSFFMRLRRKTQNLLSSKLEADFIVFWLILQVVLYCGAFGIRGGACFEEVGLYHIGIGILRYPFHGLGLFLIARVKGSEA